MEERVIELRQLVEIFRRRFFIIFFASILCAFAAFAISKYFITPMYTATASMYVFSDTTIENNITQSQLNASQELVSTYIVVLKSDTVLKQVVAKLDVDMSSADIRENLTAGAIEQTEAFSISYSDPDPVTAQRVVNTVVDVAPKEIIRVVKAGGAEVIDYANVPSTPASPNIIRNTAIGAVIGIVLSFGIAILIFLFDTKIYDEEDLTKAFDLPVLGIIPTLQDIGDASRRRGRKS